jgi:hypothetical protein
VAVWLNVVVGVQETVTWPVVGFWTSMESVETAATVPDAVENAGRGGVVLAVVVFFVAAAATSAVPATIASTAERATTHRSIIDVLTVFS